MSTDSSLAFPNHLISDGLLTRKEGLVQGLIVTSIFSIIAFFISQLTEGFLSSTLPEVPSLTPVGEESTTLSSIDRRLFLEQVFARISSASSRAAEEKFGFVQTHGVRFPNRDPTFHLFPLHSTLFTL